MPLYDLRCPDCGHELHDEYRSMHADPKPCPMCAIWMEKLPSLCHTDLKEFRTPIEMYSVAEEDPAKVRALKVACPDADVSDDPANPLYGVPVARSRKAKLQVLKHQGFEEINSERVRR